MLQVKGQGEIFPVKTSTAVADLPAACADMTPPCYKVGKAEKLISTTS